MVAILVPTVGSKVQQMSTGRVGNVIIKDGSDLPYKVAFGDGSAPSFDWFRESDLQLLNTPSQILRLVLQCAFVPCSLEDVMAWALLIADATRHGAENCLVGCTSCLQNTSTTKRQCEPDHRKLQVRITRLSGEPLCTLHLKASCTLEELKCEVQAEANIPFSRQRLVQCNTVCPLEHGVCLHELADDKACVNLVMIQVQKPPLKESSEKICDPLLLWSTIDASDSEGSLELLTLSDLPGLNRTWHDGSTVLHRAAFLGLADVCEAILERPDFTMANALDQLGLTALHCAVFGRHLHVAHVLLRSSAFTCIDSCDAQFNPHDAGGWDARAIAVLKRDTAIVEAIDAARKRRKK